jgi:hypothetical protein
MLKLETLWTNDIGANHYPSFLKCIEYFDSILHIKRDSATGKVLSEEENERNNKEKLTTMELDLDVYRLQFIENTTLDISKLQPEDLIEKVTKSN